MPITILNNIIVVNHQGFGSVDDAESLCDSIRTEVEKFVRTGKPIAIFHDSTDLTTASEAYARVFAKCFSDVKKHRPIQVAQIDRAMLRVFATVATTLSRIDMKIFKTREECFAHLRTQGFETPLLTFAEQSANSTKQRQIV